MSVRAAFLLLIPALAFSAILPDTIGPWERGETTTAAIPDAKVWNEYGLKESESVTYSDPATAKNFSVAAYRFADTTGSFAAWVGDRPHDAHQFDTDGLGVETPDGTQYITVGNLLLVFHGFKPDKDQLGHIFLTAPHYSNSKLPPLPQYLPVDAIPNSERYILGPESLAKYAGVIPPSTAAFHFDSEAETADYGKTTIVVFNFPGTEMAQKQYPAFAAIPGAVVKRTGPLVAVALHPSSPDDAERLLAQIKYQAEITVAEPPPSLKNNPGNLFLNIAILVGVLALFCVASGLIFGFIRHIVRRPGMNSEGDEMISLHLTERP